MHFILDIHCHTVASGHAYSTVNENAAWAAQKGLTLLGVADHGPHMAGACNLYHFANLHVLPDEISGVRLLKGVEANIVDAAGGLDLPPGILKRLDFVIASLHSVCFPPSDKARHTETVIRAMENPYVNIWGHPGDPAYPIDEEAVVAAAKRTHTVIEINNVSLVPGTHRYGGNETIRRLLACCKAMEVPVIAGSDAHVDRHVGQNALAQQLIEESGLKESLVLNTSVALLEEALQAKRQWQKG